MTKTPRSFTSSSHTRPVRVQGKFRRHPRPTPHSRIPDPTAAPSKVFWVEAAPNEQTAVALAAPTRDSEAVASPGSQERRRGPFSSENAALDDAVDYFEDKYAKKLEQVMQAVTDGLGGE
jgi:hypothetical protein